MKTALMLAAGAVSALSLAACQKPADQPAPAVDAASSALNSAQDATAAAVGATSAATVGANSTEGFVDGLVTSNMYEIQAGKIAEAKAQAAGVKAFGKMMVTDHTSLSNAAEPAVKASGVAIPTELDQRRKGLIDNLNAASPADFDAVYLSQQEAAHQEALTLLKGYADRGDDAALKAVATSAIPKVQAHLDKVHELQGGMTK